MTAPDPHPAITWLTRPFSAWWRVPVYTIALGVLALFAVLWLGSWKAEQVQSAAMANLIVVLKATKPYHAAIQTLQKAAQQHLAQAATHEHAAATDLVSADSAQKLADSAAAALQRDSTARDSLRHLTTEVFGLRGTADALRGTVGQQQGALLEVRAAYRDVRFEADTAERRVHLLEIAGQRVVQAEECKLLSWHPCVRNLHLGVYLGYGASASKFGQGQVGLGAMWSP